MLDTYRHKTSRLYIIVVIVSMKNPEYIIDTILIVKYKSITWFYYYSIIYIIIYIYVERLVKKSAVKFTNSYYHSILQRE